MGLAALILEREASNKINAVAARLHCSFRHFVQASLDHTGFYWGLAALIPEREASNKINAVAASLHCSFRHFAQASLAHTGFPLGLAALIPEREASEKIKWPKAVPLAIFYWQPLMHVHIQRDTNKKCPFGGI